MNYWRLARLTRPATVAKQARQRAEPRCASETAQMEAPAYRQAVLSKVGRRFAPDFLWRGIRPAKYRLRGRPFCKAPGPQRSRCTDARPGLRRSRLRMAS